MQPSERFGSIMRGVSGAGRRPAGAGWLVLVAVLGWFGLGGAGAAGAEREYEGASPDRPNIILIVADDLGYGDLGCYGQEKIQTPNIDRLAAEGMKFTDFYAGSTVCAPSRSVLMTGQHLGRTIVRGNARDPHKQSLRDADYTLAELLNGPAGYATGCVGKWGLGEPGTEGLPRQQGFDYFFGYYNQVHAHNYYPAYLWQNGRKYELENVVPGEGRFGRGWASEKKQYSHDLMMERTLRWLRLNVDTNPFFLYLPFTIPHANNEKTRGTGDGQEVPDYGQYADKDWPDPDKGQAAMISRLDRSVGRLIGLLKELGIDRETVILFTSDNGHHREGGNDPEFFDANGPLRGMKRDLYEGGIRVPLIVRWPGKVEPGSETDHVAYFGDFMATFAEVAGVESELPANLDSVSFLPTLRGKPDRQADHDYLYWEFYERGSKQAVRVGRWKAVRQPMVTGDIELYDLRRDLGEINDIADERPDLVATMERIMEAAHEPSSRWQPPSERKKK